MLHRSLARPQEDTRRESKTCFTWDNSRRSATAGLPPDRKCSSDENAPNYRSSRPSSDRHSARGGTVVFHDDLATIVNDPEMFRLAIRRAGSRELAEDAIQETARALGERKSLDEIENLRGFFYVALIHEINHQLGRPSAIPAGDAGEIRDRQRDRVSLAGALPPVAVYQNAQLRLLAYEVLGSLERERAQNGLAARIPGRSGDPSLYRTAIARAAKIIFALLLEGYVTAADWNAILKAAYPQWCDEPGLASDARDQRLSRARRDVQSLLRSVLSRDQLVS
jgi:DNA-directed RNA polymerase specialized sigma24 family protein